ncbi:MAG: phosphate/phosphite/phosphonate ABC transporter substrate-binding protein [Geminicoccaceae bacterium]
MRTGTACGRFRFYRTLSLRRRLAVLTLLWLICGAPPADLSSAAAAGSTPGYRFGVVPYLPALTIDRIFGPMAASFAIALERPVYLKTKPTFETFASELQHATYDIIFVHPFFYVGAADRHGYLPLARLDGQLTAVVLVRADRPWQTWADLAGRTIAAPPALAAVSELARVALLDAGLIPGIDTTLQHYRTKVSCLQAVSAGAVDACVLPRFVLPQINPIGDGRLRIMAERRAARHLVFAAHPRLPEAEREALRSLILSWPRTEQGRAILAIGSWPPFVGAEDADYDDVRRPGTRIEPLAGR